MNNYNNSLKTAMQFTAFMLLKVDDIFAGKRQDMCKCYHMKNGIFARA